MANEAFTGLTPEDINTLKAISLGGGVSFDIPEKQTGYTFADIEDLDVQPARSRSNHIFGMAKDVFDYMSGLDPNAYVGKTAKMTNEYMKTLAEDDPEGKMIDINRAKVLSQRASETDDIALKKRYGAEIKKLLPRETQGLDDLTASAFLVGDSEKLRQQLLKNAGNLAVQQAKNAGNIATTEMKTESNENIANTRAEALRDVANIRGQYDLSKKDKDYLREQLKQEGMSDRQADKLVADYERELMKQEHADYRTAYTADKGLEGRMYTADKGLEGRMYSADKSLEGKKYAADIALQRAQITADARVAAAKLGVKNPEGIDNATGDIVPSEGVIKAMKIIEDNPDVFTPSTSMLDTRLGRIAVLSNDTVKKRETVNQELNSLVRASVQNLMQLFPKGGSGVINTGTEQRLFLPVAEAIKSGEAAKIIAAVEAFYGQMYDAAKAYGEPAPISRQDYIDLMTKGRTSSGLTKISKNTDSTSSVQQSTTEAPKNNIVNKNGYIEL